MRRLSRIVIAAIFLALPAPAFADATVFAGFLNKPDVRPTKGFAAGIGLLIVGFEFEYATAAEDGARPGLTTGMGNALVQTPFGNVQLYATAGGGFYRRTTSDTSQTDFASNIGGGVKFGILGPLRVRLDYRIIKLRGQTVDPTVQRFYAGLNLKF